MENSIIKEKLTKEQIRLRRLSEEIQFLGSDMRRYTLNNRSDLALCSTKLLKNVIREAEKILKKIN